MGRGFSPPSHHSSEIIRFSQEHLHKSICFVTGVPDSGKTLVGLNIATKHIDKNNNLYSVFLSGNGPLVMVLREALARDKVRHEKEHGRKLKKREAISDVKMFIQNVHGFRDECLVDLEKPPIEHTLHYLTKLNGRGIYSKQQISCNEKRKCLISTNLSQNS